MAKSENENLSARWEFFFQSVKLWEALYVRMITYLITSDLNMSESCNGEKTQIRYI